MDRQNQQPPPDGWQHYFERLRSQLFEGSLADLGHEIRKMRDIHVTPVEREFDEDWANELANRVRNGRAVSFLWAEADMKVAGGQTVRFRVNGQHSSWALLALLDEGVNVPGLAIHYDTYSVANQDGAVMLFRQFDHQKSARSKEDISGAYQCFHEAIRACKRSRAKKAI